MTQGGHARGGEPAPCGGTWTSLGHPTVLHVEGSDRLSFLHNLCTQDIKALTPGLGAEAFLTNVQGRILGYVTILCRTDCLWIVTVPEQASRLSSHLDRYHITEDVRIEDRSIQYLEFFLFGQGIVGRLCDAGCNMPKAPNAHVLVQIQDTDVVVIAMPRRWPAAVRWLVPVSGQVTVTSWLASHELPEVGNERWELARIEHGMPWYGRDISEENLPQEVDRNDDAISFRKGCYLGQETVARIDALGHVNWLLRGLRLEGTRVPPAGQTLNAPGRDRVAARITSAAFSPQHGSVIALGYVRREHAQAGRQLEGAGWTATVVDTNED